MARLSIYLLGSFLVTLDDKPVTGFDSDKARALLAYLAVESDHSHRRESLAGLLWPDCPERTARRSLAGALANVRSVIGDHDAVPRFILSTHQEIQFNRASDSWIDAVACTAPLQCRGSEPDADPRVIVQLEEATKLYRGEFLKGFSIADSDLFEQWALRERGRLEGLVFEALEHLIEWHESRGQRARSLLYARQQVDLAPWQENAHRQVMRLLALEGRRAEALKQWETCREILRAELDVEPDETTVALYELIKAGGLQPLESAPSVSRLKPPTRQAQRLFLGPHPYGIEDKSGLGSVSQSLSQPHPATQLTGHPPPTASLKKVFICYKQHAEPDRTLVLHLNQWLVQIGYSVFLDTRLRLGEEWLEALEREIRESDFMVVVLSKQSVGSEMVRAEVQCASEFRQQHGHPQMLPIRLAYEDRLPLAIGAYLSPLQYVVWKGIADNDAVCHEVQAAIEGRLAPKAPFAPALPGGQLTVADDGRMVTGEGTIHPPLPEFDPQSLDAPGGAVKLSDRFYVERRGDAAIRREILKPGSLTYIRAPRQTGKSSLLIRGIRHARDRQRSAIFVDFQLIDAAHLADLDTFLRCLADLVGRELRIGGADEVWQTPLAATIKMSSYLENRVLRPASAPVLLAMDEVDRLFGVPFQNDFFGLLRAWHNKSSVDETWRKLSIAMALSTEPYLLIDDVYQSPFNVGTRVELDDFDEAQVVDLNDRHGSPLNASEVHEMATLLGGQPYLTRKALYTCVAEDLSWVEIVKHAIDERSPFSDHLRRYLWLVRDRPELAKAVKQVLKGGLSPDEPAAQRLQWAGVIRREGGGCLFRCPLYEAFFERHLP